MAVPSPLSVKLRPEGSVPVLVMVGRGDPLVVMVLLPAVPTVKLAVLLLLNEGAWSTEMVRIWVALGLTPLLAVRLSE